MAQLLRASTRNVTSYAERQAGREIQTAIHYPVPPHRTESLFLPSASAPERSRSPSRLQIPCSVSPWARIWTRSGVAMVVDAVRAFPH